MILINKEKYKEEVLLMRSFLILKMNLNMSENMKRGMLKAVTIIAIVMMIHYKGKMIIRIKILCQALLIKIS